MVQDAEPVSFAMMDFNRLLQSGASKPYSHCRGSDGGHETLSQILDPRVIAPTMVESLEIQMECVNHTRLNVKEKTSVLEAPHLRCFLHQPGDFKRRKEPTT